MSKHRTQVERVVAAARSYRGVTQVDFLLPDVCDGGPPITRVGARLWDAEQDGYSFECIGKRDRCKVFRLCGEPDVERTSDVPSPSPPGQGAAVTASGVVSRGDGDAGLIPRASVAGSLDAGVEGDCGEWSADGGVFASRPSNPEPASPTVALSTGRLFDMEPERVGHYDEAKAA